jgi:hypothetical protein
MRQDQLLRPRHLAHYAIFAALFSSVAGCAPATAEDAIAGESDDRTDAVGEGAAYTLWIHGRNPGSTTEIGNYDDFSYWGSAATAAGVNKKAVNWDGRGRISESNAPIRNALDCFCTGANICYIAAHSAGDAQIGYALDFYGGSSRQVTDAQPDGSGACGGTGATQTGWNIQWIDVAGGAGGGTELADLGYWAVSDPLTSDLRTATVRSLYDHGNTGGAMFYMFAGAKGTLYSGILPGQDDEVIAYHSSGGLSGTGKFCNPGNWFCNDTLRYNEAGSTRGSTAVPKWSMHSTYYRDDAEALDHYTKNAWGGIVSAAREDIAAYAQ